MALRCFGLEEIIMDEYLAFIDFIGRTVNGGYIYRLDFTLDTDTVWGEFFNVVPSALIPDLQPDINCISKTFKIITENELILATNSYCFSMQDCIDGINPLCFSEINENTIVIDEKPLYFSFGEKFDDILETLSKINIEPFEINNIDHGDYSAIDDFLDNNDDNDLD